MVYWLAREAIEALYRIDSAGESQNGYRERGERTFFQTNLVRLKSNMKNITTRNREHLNVITNLKWK